jgi:tRNA-Thr(GGU) m(6)t(6)A37 methyltransferase TsaA
MAFCQGVAQPDPGDAPRSEEPEASFKLFPVGKVEKDGSSTRVRIFKQYADALLGLEEWSHVNVLYWFHENDDPAKRRTLRVHPRGNPENPLTGVFACRSPVRPNLIALTVCKVVSVRDDVLEVDAIDALDGTPVLDLKPHIPPDEPRDGVRVPRWAR